MLLLDVTEAVGIIAKLMLLLYLIIILAPIIYAVTIYLLIGRKYAVWRIIGWILATGFFALGINVAGPTNEWGIFNAIFFAPIVVGLFNEYRLWRSLSA